MWCSIFKKGNNLNIEIYKKHSQQLKAITFGHTSEDKFFCKASIKLDDLWKCLVSECHILENSV